MCIIIIIIIIIILAQGGWGTEVPNEVQGQSPGGVCGTMSPRTRRSLQTLFTDFDCRKDQNLKISLNSSLDS